MSADISPSAPESGAATLPSTPAEVADLLGSTGYLADTALATITFLGLAMQRPLLLEGEPGTGKTSLAEALASSLGCSLIRLQCYEGIDATQALYDWDFPRQILHLRTLEALGRTGAGECVIYEDDAVRFQEGDTVHVVIPPQKIVVMPHEEPGA